MLISLQFTEEPVQFMYPDAVKSTITIEFQKDRQMCFFRHLEYSHIFASTHGDHTVKIVDFGTGRILRVSFYFIVYIVQTLIGHPRTPWAVRFHPRNPDILVSGCIGSVVIVWDWKKNEILANTIIMPNVMVTSLDWHPTYFSSQKLILREESILIACGTTVYIWNYEVIIIIILYCRKIFFITFSQQVQESINLHFFMEMEKILQPVLNFADYDFQRMKIQLIVVR